MTTKTKDKVSKTLKNKLIDEMKGKKETERLERVKENSKIKGITIYTKPNDKSYLEFLDSEGIKYKHFDVSKNPIEWKKTTALTNLGITPTIVVNDIFHLARDRDFTNTQQLLQGIKYLSDSRNQTPTDLNKILEHAKTNNYYLFQRINALENTFKPMFKFMENLEKQLAEEIEEEKGE